MSDQSHSSQPKPPVAAGIEGLDDAFLRYIGVQSETQRYIQEGYLAWFAGCSRVVDLGCGDGDFLALLQENGHECLGVDGDSRAAQRVRELGLPVIQADVLAWLAAEADAIEQGKRPGWDGLFCAHLVEHLPYTSVLELCQQAGRILRPGGVIVLATPNVAAIHAHLDGYYKHFGHITFYHPDLLSFFLDYTGFAIVETGANERVPSTLFFPVIRELNEHQVELNRLEAVCEGLLPQHSRLAEQSSASHNRFGEIYAGFSAVHTAISQILPGITKLISTGEPPATAAKDDSAPQSPSVLFRRLQQIHSAFSARQQVLSHPGIAGRLRRKLTRLLLGSYADTIEQSLAQSQELVNVVAHINQHSATNAGHYRQAAEQFQSLTDAVAQLNLKSAQMAELWVGSQTIQDELDDLAARYGTVLRDLGRVSRRTEEATRLLIGQIDAPFEAFVVARRPLPEEMPQ